MVMGICDARLKSILYVQQIESDMVTRADRYGAMFQGIQNESTTRWSGGRASQNRFLVQVDTLRLRRQRLTEEACRML